MRANNYERNPWTDLVLDLVSEPNGTWETFYYFADHATRTVFYIDIFPANFLPIWSQVRGATSPSHIRRHKFSKF